MAAATKGWLVLVVGPSGAGKDTLIRAAAALLADDPAFAFPRRIVTRLEPHPGEDSIPMTESEFRDAAHAGRFLIRWAAHGLNYAIDGSVRDALFRGRIVAVNISRSMIGEAEAAWPLTVVIHITAPRDVLAARIAARGRESLADAATRLAREAQLTVTRSQVIEILNDGPIATGADRLVSALRSLPLHDETSA